MTLLLLFAITLLIAVLISEVAERSILSSALLFLVAGYLAGRGLVGPVPQLTPNFLERLSEVTLFSILFSDGMRTGGVQTVLHSWRLPGRALVIGMPLTIVGIALLARFMLGVTWAPAFLVAAVLGPTDPVFVSAIFRFDAIPDRVKRLLNIESGLNDGVALPLVLLLLTQLTAKGEHLAGVAVELVAGIVVGVLIPWLAIRLEASRFFKAVGLFEPLNAFAIGLLVLAICYRLGANLFLGAYAAGISVITFSSSVAESFERFGELIAELLKLAALLVFGAMIAPNLFRDLSVWDYLFIVIATFAVRPPTVVLSLAGTQLKWGEKFIAGWFGPKGFASVVYGLLILQAGQARLAHLVGLAVVASVIIFSSTDILVGRWFERHGAARSPSEASPPQQPNL